MMPRAARRQRAGGHEARRQPGARAKRPLYTPVAPHTLRILKGGASPAAKAPQLFQHLVKPLVVERARHWAELHAELAGFLLHAVDVEGAAAGPGFHYGEMIRETAL